MMSEMFTSEMEVEEGSPMGGAECSESPVHMMEPQVELDETFDHSTLEPNVELEENMVEPQVEFQEGTDQSENNEYPFDPLAPEYFEPLPDTDSAVDSAGLNGLSQDSEDTNNTEVALNSNSMCNSGDTSLDGGMDTSNSMLDASYKEDDNTDYNEMQRTYLNDFFSPSAEECKAYPSSTAEESNETENLNVERIPLCRFPSIVKVVERAEYETIQILYQLLYQRSAWDTQEILSKRILEFSGFPFNKNSEEYYNRVMLLQTLPNSVLVKIGAILCLEQVKNVLSNVGLGRHDLINAIMEFLALPRKKTRASRFSNANVGNKRATTQIVEPCGCRNNCLSKFNDVERELIATHHTTFKQKKKSQLYFLSLITINKASKRPDEDAKKHRDYKYMYKIKIGRKEVSVCKGGFMMLHNVKMSMLNHLQMVLKTEKYDKKGLAQVVYPFLEGPEYEEQPATTPTNDADSKENSSASESSNNISQAVTVDEELKKKLASKVPAIVIEKIDPNKVNSPQQKKKQTSSENDTTAGTPATNKDDGVRKKLREFPLVVKSMNEVAETLLIDLHFLLFSSSAESDKVKDNILDFDGFKFSVDSEEYDERNDFLQRMSGKLLTDVARAFSIGVMSKREETIQNILSFLMKPDESYLRASVSVPVILSDVELDDMEGFSDSDESITCEVVEKKVECIDLIESGEDSDGEEKPKKKTPVKVEPKPKVTVVPASASSSTFTSTTAVASSSSTPATSATTTPATPTTSSTTQSEGSGGIRRLRDFETIRKIVNTHPPEYLVDIYELLFLKKNEVNADTLRNEILDFTGFTFEKGSQDYVKRKQVLDRMLYNNVRRVYNTLIHNSTEVKVFSKPTMINEIFQFLFKLPDHDTSVRPLPPGAKTLMPKTPGSTTTVKKTTVVSAPPTSAPASILPSQSGKLSDLKRVFQRVACFPCEYLVDVHKLLFMTDCDPKVIRQNIFGFKGFSFGVDSTEFQQRKMYLEYLTFHSLRKISSVLTTRSVDLRNSTKHELASHLTDVLAEYCNTCIDTESITPASAKDIVSSGASTATTASTVTGTPEKIVVTPTISTVQSVAQPTPKAAKNSPATSKASPLNISIVETHTITSPAVTTPAKSTRGRKRKNQTVRQIVEKKATPSPNTQPSDFADIHLPEIEQYRQIYGANLNVLVEEYAEFLDSPFKPAKIRPPRQRNYKQPQKCLFNSSEYVTVSPVDIENIKKIKWVVVLERIDINVYGKKADCLKYDNFVPETKTDIHNMTEDHHTDPVIPTPNCEESAITSHIDQSQLLYESIFSLIDPPCKESISTKDQPKDCFIKDPSVPAITGITSYASPVSQTFSQLVPQTVTFPQVFPYPQTLQMSGIQQSAQVIGLQSTPITMTTPIITQVTSPVNTEIIVPADIEQPESQKTKAETPGEKSSNPSKDSPNKDSEEDGDQPLAALIGHPTDAVLQKQISDIVDKTDLQDITMNGVIQRIYGLYPKFDLSYRKEFIKSTLRSILYKLGENGGRGQERDTDSPDCIVSTSDIQDNSAQESPKASA